MQEERGVAVPSILPVWREALCDEPGASFAKVVTPRVRLEGSIFATPIDGPENVWTCLRAAGRITEKLTFTHESSTPERTCLEWEMDAFGQRFDGVSVLVLDAFGLIDNVAIHHRPLGAILAISAEMGRLLGNSVGPDVFYRVPEGS